MSCEIVVVLTEGISFDRAEGYVKYLSAFRRKKLSKKKNDEDKLLSLTAGLLAAHEISRRTGIPRNKLRYGHTTFGKPYLIGNDLCFSISHTKGAVCAAFSECEVGADIELSSRKVNPKLYDRVLSERERLSVNSNEDFLRLWVCKEAFLKRVGTGIATDLRGADTSLLTDTKAVECGDYLVGISCKGADNAKIRVITLSELLKEYDKLCL